MDVGAVCFCNGVHYFGSAVEWDLANHCVLLANFSIVLPAFLVYKHQSGTLCAVADHLAYGYVSGGVHTDVFK